jgi:hypothetical protein
MPVDAFLLGVDINEGEHARAGQQRGLDGQLRQHLPVHLLQLQHIPQVNERRNDPSVGGARTPPNRPGSAPGQQSP